MKLQFGTRFMLWMMFSVACGLVGYNIGRAQRDRQFQEMHKAYSEILSRALPPPPPPTRE